MKSVLTKGAGLFGTHVFLEDVQSVMAQQMETPFEVTQDSALAVVGDGNGFMSKVVLVDSVPSKFILKIASCLQFQLICEKFKSNGSVHQFTPEVEAAMQENFERQTQELHNREVNFYEILKSWSIDDGLLAPKMYFSRKFDAENEIKGFLGMEFVENAEIRHLYENVRVEELRPILRSLALLQSKSLSMTDQERETIEGYDFERLMSQILSEIGLKGILDAIRMLDEGRLGEKVNSLEAIGRGLVNFDLARNLNKYIGIKRDVLVHGDLWSANVLWTKDGDHFLAEKVIDYQLIHFGNPAEDLVRLFLTTLSGADRRANWERLLEEFYEQFVRFLKEEHVPYTLEQLKRSYHCYFVTAGLVVLPMFGPMTEIKMDQSGECEESAKHRQVLLEKAECLLEDIAEYHHNLL